MNLTGDCRSRKIHLIGANAHTAIIYYNIFLKQEDEQLKFYQLIVPILITQDFVFIPAYLKGVFKEMTLTSNPQTHFHLFFLSAALLFKMTSTAE